MSCLEDSPKMPVIHRFCQFDRLSKYRIVRLQNDNGKMVTLAQSLDYTDIYIFKTDFECISYLDTRQLLYNSRNCIKMSYNSMSSCKTLSSTSLFRKVSVQHFMCRKKRTFVHNYDVALLFNPVSNCIYFFR